MLKKLFAVGIAGLLSASLYAAEATVEKVDINTADAATLDRGLDSVGAKKAAAIIQYRTEHGPFKKIEDLDQVAGIGAGIIAKNRDRIIISVPAAPATNTVAQNPRP
ncbi:MAG: helix-hairpin-helix domain-containing protein [Thiotrichaceae bacterium]|nr:helix-hairpin-helix domain-containing protein [Thiotrichaceae bacterium]